MAAYSSWRLLDIFRLRQYRFQVSTLLAPWHVLQEELESRQPLLDVPQLPAVKLCSPAFRLRTHASPSCGVMSTHHSPPTLIFTVPVLTMVPLIDALALSGTLVSHSARMLRLDKRAAKRSNACRWEVSDGAAGRMGMW